MAPRSQDVKERHFKREISCRIIDFGGKLARLALFWRLIPTNLNNTAVPNEIWLPDSKAKHLLERWLHQWGWGFYDTINHILELLAKDKSHSEMRLINKAWLPFRRQLITRRSRCVFSPICDINVLSGSSSVSLRLDGDETLIEAFNWNKKKKHISKVPKNLQFQSYFSD